VHYQPEAARRIAEAEDLGERRALTGQLLAPLLSQTAAAQRAGLVGDGHVKVSFPRMHGATFDKTAGSPRGDPRSSAWSPSVVSL
jgi:hypothetical protein